MATDVEVRQAVADTLAAVEGLRTHAFTPGTISGLSAVVISLDVQFDAAMQRGSDRMLATVRLLAGGELKAAQVALSDLIYRARSALWNDPTLGGAVSDARLARKRGDSEGQLDAGGATLTVVDVEIEVIT